MWFPKVLLIELPQAPIGHSWTRITSKDPVNAINRRQIFAFNKITQMIVSDCLSNPSPSQPGKSLAIAQIQAFFFFFIVDENCSGSMTVLLSGFASSPHPSQALVF